MNKNFYSELSSFKDFQSVFNKSTYSDVPDDWYVVVCDIKGSTKAVAEGKYKDVNLIGAACVGTLSKIGDDPFVFGGDGASFLIDPENLEPFLNELLKVKLASKNRFSLNLKVGFVQVSELMSLGTSVKIAKYELSKDKYIAKFSGGGLSKADELIKSDSKYEVISNSSIEANFDNLSCRWQPILNKNGIILTLIVYSKNFDRYQEIFECIGRILDFNSDILNPIKSNGMSYHGFRQMFREEKKFVSSVYSFKFFLRFMEICFAFLLFNRFPKLKPKSIKNYTKSMERYSDFKKFDDTLRMVVDCSEEQKEQIDNYLKAQKDISYGMSISDSALMTCLVESLDDGGHIHFVDGSDGGYTKASKSMKDSKASHLALTENP